jgi:hypothetical protein
MSPDKAKDVVGVLYLLLPGFVAAWVFFGLTAHPKADWFERIVQALIFTVIVQAVTFVVRVIAVGLGKAFVPLGSWNVEVNLVWSLLVATLIGVSFSAAANLDWPHKLLRDKGLTRRTSFPSEWFSVFCQNKRWVVLHLTGNRRLFGWPNEWPDQADKGHFVIEQPEWFVEQEKREPIKGVDRIVIRASDVEMVEFMLYDEEINAEKQKLEMAKNLNSIS